MREHLANSEFDVDRLIGERLKSLRAARGWSLDELAGLSGVSRATLSRLETPVSAPPPPCSAGSAPPMA